MRRGLPRAPGAGSCEVGEDEHEERGVAAAVGEGRASSLASCSSTFACSAVRRRARRSIAADCRRRPPSRTRGASSAASAPVPQPRSATVHRAAAARAAPRRATALAVHLGAELVPRPGGAREEAPRPVAPRPDRRRAAPRPAATAAHPSLSARVERARAAARPASSALACRRGRCVPCAPAREPALLGEDLQVAADRRLREREHLAQLEDRELLALEHVQEPQPRRVGEGVHPAEEGLGRAGGEAGEAAGRASINPDGRIYAGRRPRSRRAGRAPRERARREGPREAGPVRRATRRR